VPDPLSPAERLKFRLLSSGLAILPEAQAHVDHHNGDRPMTPADYASTSGVILELDRDVWVNAPIATYNPNFVEDPEVVLDLGEEGLEVRAPGMEVTARFWLPPAYHEQQNAAGEPYTSYAFTHADRVRVSPIEGCSMTCKFCDLPYEFRYRTKRVEGIVDSVRQAVEDPVQPAHHVLISGGTPHERDYGYLREVYEAVATTFPEIGVDVMMVPIDDVMDLEWLHDIGVDELSINIEIYDQDLAPKIMRRKAAQGLPHYLDTLERGAQIFGPGKVRSMLMVGIEPIEQTLAGVTAIAERGAVPVLSPFRPDQATPMGGAPPPTEELLVEAYLRSQEIARAHDVPLGPTCIPCSHNTLTLATSGVGDAGHHHGHPHLI
jgi:hypothetical protein